MKKNKLIIFMLTFFITINIFPKLSIATPATLAVGKNSLSYFI